MARLVVYNGHQIHTCCNEEFGLCAFNVDIIVCSIVNMIWEGLCNHLKSLT